MSFGGGVNSVAMYLLLLEKGVEFEAVYVDHGADWPETGEYVKMFAKRFPLTILTPNVEGETTLYGYCIKRGMMPSRIKRWCTDKFKVRILMGYAKPPCFQLIGIDAGESHRAKISSVAGVENRYPLIEDGIDRAGCIDLIKRNGLPVPMKSGCYFCPYQRVSQWKKLRKEHPDLWCKAVGIEASTNRGRDERGKNHIYLYGKDKPLSAIVNEQQNILPGMEEMEYPPCQCGL